MLCLAARSRLTSVILADGAKASAEGDQAGKIPVFGL